MHGYNMRGSERTACTWQDGSAIMWTYLQVIRVKFLQQRSHTSLIEVRVVITVSGKLPQPVTALDHEMRVTRLHLGQHEGCCHLPSLADA